MEEGAGASSSAQEQRMQVATIGASSSCMCLSCLVCVSISHISSHQPAMHPQGFPHLGGKRQLKHLLEGFWEGRLSEGDVRKG